MVQKNSKTSDVYDLINIIIHNEKISVPPGEWKNTSRKDENKRSYARNRLPEFGG